jgi:hypothetical protein
VGKERGEKRVAKPPIAAQAANAHIRPSQRLARPLGRLVLTSRFNSTSINASRNPSRIAR